MINSDEFWMGFSAACLVLLFFLLITAVIDDKNIEKKSLQRLHNVYCEQVVRS